MWDWVAKTLGRTSPSPEATQTVVLAFLLGALAQLLKLLDLLLPVSFFLCLTAVLSLHRVFAQRPPPPDDTPRPLTARRRQRWRALGWLLSTGGSAGAAACSLALYHDFARYLLPVLVAGPLSLVALAAGEDLLAGYDLRPRVQVAWRRRESLPLLLILAVGLLFRFGTVGSFPPPDGSSSIEEMQRASGGAAILDGQRPWEFPLAQYLNAASFAAFGRSIYAVRLPATAMAWLTLPIFYLLSRRLVERPAALFATALLAVSRWHCQVGWYNEDVYVPLLPFAFLLYLLLRTRREPRPSLYVAAGALCGYMLYDYAAYRGAVAVALGFFAADSLWRRSWPEDWRSIALLFAVVGLFALPLAGVLNGMGGTAFYVEALDRSLSDTRYYTSDPTAFIRQRLERINQAADVFTYSDHVEFFPTLNLPGAPLLDPFTSVFFTLGFGSTLLLWRRRRHYGFYALSFLSLATGAMVVPWNLDFRRLAVLIPLAFLFTALLAQEVDALALSSRWQPRWRWLLALVAVCAAAYNTAFLFLWFAPDHEVRASHRTPYSVAGYYLQHHYTGEYVLLLSPEVQNFFEANDYDWMKPPLLEGRGAGGVEDVLSSYPPAPRRRDLLILIARPFDILTVMSQVLGAYAGSTCEFLRDPDSERHDLAVCRVGQRTEQR